MRHRRIPNRTFRGESTLSPFSLEGKKAESQVLCKKAGKILRIGGKNSCPDEKNMIYYIGNRAKAPGGLMVKGHQRPGSFTKSRRRSGAFLFPLTFLSFPRFPRRSVFRLCVHLPDIPVSVILREFRPRLASAAILYARHIMRASLSPHLITNIYIFAYSGLII